jgi:hypothetical protein
LKRSAEAKGKLARSDTTLSRSVLPQPLGTDQSRDVSDVVSTLHWLASLAPTRLTGTKDERAVQDAIAERLVPHGFVATFQPFRFPRHIYGSLAMHFGLGLVFVGVGYYLPWLGALGHLLIAGSFYAEAVHRRHVLRVLWPSIATQNLILTKPASAPLRRRVVLLAHVDSAYTGLMFHPPVLRQIAKPPPSFLPFLKKQLLLPFVALLVLMVFEAAHPMFATPLWLLGVLSIPLWLVFLLNIEIVIRNRVVPGAGDNLSGCATQIIIGETADVPSDVELVLAFTGAEEAGTGGAGHLARVCRWDRAITEVVVLDTLSNGTLHLLEEGELFSMTMPEDLVKRAQAAARSVGEAEPTRYPVPAGATDALPFLVEGYRALALTCIDPVQHAPRNYHHPNDTADRVEPKQLEASTRVAQALVRDLLDR